MPVFICYKQHKFINLNFVNLRFLKEKAAMKSKIQDTSAGGTGDAIPKNNFNDE